MISNVIFLCLVFSNKAFSGSLYLWEVGGKKGKTEHDLVIA